LGTFGVPADYTRTAQASDNGRLDVTVGLIVTQLQLSAGYSGAFFGERWFGEGGTS
jgi:hypothetical protein